MKKIEEVIAALNARLESTELGTFYDRDEKGVRFLFSKKGSGSFFREVHSDQARGRTEPFRQP